MKNTIYIYTYIYIYVFIYVNIFIDIYLIYLYHCMCFIEMFFKSIFRSISIPSQLERCSKTVYIYIYICTSFYAGLIIFTFDFVHICTIWGYRRLYSCCIWLCGMIIGNDPVPDSQNLSSDVIIFISSFTMRPFEQKVEWNLNSPFPFLGRCSLTGSVNCLGSVNM